MTVHFIFNRPYILIKIVQETCNRSLCTSVNLLHGLMCSHLRRIEKYLATKLLHSRVNFVEMDDTTRDVAARPKQFHHRDDEIAVRSGR